MNRQKRRIFVGVALLIVLIVGFICYAFGSAIAHRRGDGAGYGRGGGPGYGHRFHGWNQREDSANGWFMRDEMWTAHAETLAELSGQSQDTIKEKLAYKPVWAVLDEYKIDFQTYQSKMRNKAEEILDKAVADGKISNDRKSFMLERMGNGPKFGGGCGFGAGRGNNFAGGPYWY